MRHTTSMSQRRGRLLALAATLLAGMTFGLPAAAETACPTTKVIRAVEDLLRADGEMAQMEAIFSLSNLQRSR